MKVDRTVDGNTATVIITPQTPNEAINLERRGLPDLCRQYEIKVGDTLVFGESDWSEKEVVKRVGESSFSAEL